jgi:hypothetical protein
VKVELHLGDDLPFPPEAVGLVVAHHRTVGIGSGTLRLLEALGLLVLKAPTIP